MPTLLHLSLTRSVLPAALSSAVMYHRRLVYSGVLATLAAASASTALCQPNRTAATAAAKQSSPAAAPHSSDVLDSPLFQRQPGPISITLPPTLPPRPSHLHPMLAIAIVRHGARTPVLYLNGQSPADFAQLWGQCHAIDAKAGNEIDPGTAGGRESEAHPEQLPRANDTPADENATVPCGRGQLTQTGERQLREVGAMLRRQYVEQDKLLPATFTPSALALRSSNITRTRLSAVRLVQGLYPGTPLATIRPLINVKPERDEDMYPMYRYCDRLRELFHSTLQHPLYQRYLDSGALASFQQQADRLLISAPFEPQQQQRGEGKEIKRSWIALSDEVKCRQGEGLPLPAGVDEAMAARINRCAEFLFHSLLKAGEHDTEDREAEVTAMLDDRRSVYNENARLGIGRFIQSGLLPVFQQASTAVSSAASFPRLHVFAAHDSSVVAIMNAVGLDASLRGEWPPFASYVVMEVMADDKDSRYVRVVYNGELAADTVELDEWMRRLKNVRVEDYEKECRPRGKGEVPPQSW